MLPWRQLIRAKFHPFSVQIDCSVLHCGNADWCHWCAICWSTYVFLMNELITWEKIFIHKHAHHIMNFEVPPVSSLIRKYIFRLPDSALMAPISIATMQDTSVDLNWEWAKHRPKQFSSGKQIIYLSWRLLKNENYDIYLHC